MQKVGHIGCRGGNGRRGVCGHARKGNATKKRLSFCQLGGGRHGSNDNGKKKPEKRVADEAAEGQTDCTRR